MQLDQLIWNVQADHPIWHFEIQIYAPIQAKVVDLLVIKKN